MKIRWIGVLCIALLVSFQPGAAGAKDPVTEYINTVTSLLAGGERDSLRAYVGAHSILSGAAVGRLVDEALTLPEEGRRASFHLAETVAEVHRDSTGSSRPWDLLSVYRSWTEEQLAVRRRAGELDRQATETRDRGELGTAIELYEQARTLYEQIGDTRSLAILWGSLGVTNWYRNDMAQVRVCYEHALPLRRRIEDSILEGKTLNGLGSVSFQQGRYREAVDYYNGAIDLRRRTGDIQGLVTSYSYRGATYIRLSELIDARRSFEAALPLLESAGTPLQKLEIYNNIGILNSEMGRYGASVEAYERAIQYVTAAGDAKSEASIRINMAVDLRIAGRFRESLKQLESAGEALGRSPDPEQTALLHNNRGLTYLLMGELDAAKEDLIRFLEESNHLQNPHYGIEANINLAYLYRELGAYRNGLGTVERAREKAEQLGDDRMVREALYIIADLETKLGNYQRALESAQGALELDKKGGFEEKILEDLLSIANARSYQNHLEEARAQFREAGALARKLGRESTEWAVDFGMGHSYEREAPDSAHAYYERALARVERVGSRIGGEEIHSGFFSHERRRYYEEVARFYASNSSGNDDVWSERAFHTIERAKSRGLLELLENNIGHSASGEEAVLLDSLYAVKTAFPDDRGRQRGLESRYIELRERRLKKQLGTLGSRADIARIGLVQAALPDESALVEYALGDTTSLMWIVTPEHHRLFTLPPRGELGRQVQMLLDAVKQPGRADAVLKRSAYDLYRLLIEPARLAIGNAHTVIIVPDGVLFELPFELLLTKEPAESDAWSACKWLAGEFETVYVPSSSIFLELMNRSSPERFDLDLVAIGDPDFSRLDEPAERLPYTKTEVESIGALLPAKRRLIVTGREASEHAVKMQLASETERILHFATHGYADPVEPVLSSILLAREEGEPDDGYLHTLEILSLPLETNLVVLSACESARGRLSRGEGVLGLGRALFAAGAKGVVASLWAVADNSTAVLMTRLYEQMLRERHPARTALHEARRRLMADEAFSHPFYWAPFILIGSTETPW